MRISVFNLYDRLEDGMVRSAIQAVNRQIRQDFRRHWHIRGQLRKWPVTRRHRERLMAGERGAQGDAAIYLRKRPTFDFDSNGGVFLNKRYGFHGVDKSGYPFAEVFIDEAGLDQAQNAHHHWSVTLSHEALELLGNPFASLCIPGPHPFSVQNTPKAASPNYNRQVYHCFELCDTVQDDPYEVDGIQVSNFVLPGYFERSGEERGPVDFIGNREAARRTPVLKSFGARFGGYVSFYEPSQDHVDAAIRKFSLTTDTRRRPIWKDISSRGLPQPRIDGSPPDPRVQAARH
jgi:hypothetical protein